jgi:hypothetical protein
MVEFEAGEAVELAAQLGLWQTATAASAAPQAQIVVPEEQVQEFILPLLRKVLAFSERHELHSLRTVRGHLTSVERGTRGVPLSMALRESSAQFAGAIHDSRVWRMTRDEATLYDLTNPINAPASLGEETVEDGVEAARCYAASRYTAAGFHAMRIAERVARSLVPKAGLRTKKFYPSIDSIICDIEKRLRAEEKRRRAKPKGKRRIPIAKFKWLTSVVATFRSVATGWRNPIGHYKMCDRVEALELINAARALVRQFGEA